MDLGFEHKSFRIYQQVPLSAFHLLAAIVTTLFSTYPARLYRLAIDDASAGLRVSLEANPNPLTQRSVHLLPGSIQAELSEVVVDAAPRREVVGQKPPGTTAANDVEDGIYDLPCRIDARTSGSFGSGKMWLQVVPFGIGEVGWICCSHAC